MEKSTSIGILNRFTAPLVRHFISRFTLVLNNPLQCCLGFLCQHLAVCLIFPLPTGCSLQHTSNSNAMQKFVQCGTQRVYFPKCHIVFPALRFHRSAGLFVVCHLFTPPSISLSPAPRRGFFMHSFSGRWAGHLQRDSPSSSPERTYPGDIALHPSAFAPQCSISLTSLPD